MTTSPHAVTGISYVYIKLVQYLSCVEFRIYMMEIPMGVHANGFNTPVILYYHSRYIYHGVMSCTYICIHVQSHSPVKPAPE